MNENLLRFTMRSCTVSEVSQNVDSKNEEYVLNARDVRGTYTKKMVPVK